MKELKKKYGNKIYQIGWKSRSQLLSVHEESSIRQFQCQPFLNVSQRKQLHRKDVHISKLGPNEGNRKILITKKIIITVATTVGAMYKFCTRVGFIHVQLRVIKTKNCSNLSFIANPCLNYTYKQNLLIPMKFHL
jgi:hypothetical protein